MIDTVPEDARYEIKFVAHEMEFHRILQWIRLHKEGFYIPYEDRWVNNVYFDTYIYSSYAENLSGTSQRTKVRYRWYGKNPYPQKGTLEIKCKRNYFGWKHNYPVETSPYMGTDSWKSIRKNLIIQINDDAKVWLDSYPQPIIINRYKRKYFISKNQKIRITVDSNQSVYDQRYKPYINIKHKSNIPKTMILEIKFDRRDKELVFKIIETLPIRVSRHSKYMVGVKSLDSY